MTSKILYFTADTVPTSGELADIQKLNDAAEPAYSVNVMDSTSSILYGGQLKECDFVAGTVPTAYNAKTTIDPDNLPVQGLEPTQTVLSNGATVNVIPATGSSSLSSAQAAITDGVLTGVRIGATKAVLNDTTTVTLLPATGTTPAQGSATAAVAGNAVTGVRLPATSAVVTNGQVINVTGGTVTITVAANVVTAAFTATP